MWQQLSSASVSRSGGRRTFCGDGDAPPVGLWGPRRRGGVLTRVRWSLPRSSLTLRCLGSKPSDRRPSWPGTREVQRPVRCGLG
ncbi:hypothetical protein AGIG_G14833 [Arapaima gigas]